MKFQPLTQEEIQARQEEFRERLRMVYRWGKERGLSMEAVAGTSKSQLSRVLDLDNPDPCASVPRPDEQSLSQWCYVWYTNGVINPKQVEYIMNLAGYASPFQQRRASKATTEHRAIAPLKSTHVNTEELQPLDTRKNVVRS